MQIDILNMYNFKLKNNETEILGEVHSFSNNIFSITQYVVDRNCIIGTIVKASIVEG